jgi:adenylate cyclase
VTDADPTPADLVPRGRLHLPEWLDRLLSFAVLPDDTMETIRSKRLLSGAVMAGMPVTLLSMFELAFGSGVPGAALIVGATFLTSAGALLAMWWNPKTFPGVMHVIVLVNILVSSSLVILFGGFLASGANSVWGMLVVLGAVAIFEDGRAVFWLVVYVIVNLVAAAIAANAGPVMTLPEVEFNGLFNLMIVAVFIFFILLYYVRQRAMLLRQSDALLRNVLPDSIAERLKRSDDRIAESFESASILFADVAGFTPMSAEMTPEELVALLDQVFSGFDDLVEERGLEKIKTIGDAYMAAAGVPRSRPDHAVAICDLALAMQEQVETREYGGRRIRFRIGINSGPVVAGIIGRRKFSYDLWGDAVNTASRMESLGTPGVIQITESTCRLIQAEFVCEPQGHIEVKGKGSMPVWHLIGRRLDEPTTDDRHR